MQHPGTGVAFYARCKLASPPPQPFRCPWRQKMDGGRRVPRRSPIAAQLELRPPPFPLSSLEPHMSRETLETHWGGHHRAHVDRLNALTAGTNMDGMRLEEIIIATYNKGNPLPVFAHAAQVWNHDFFWQSIKPNGGGRPSGKLMGLIERDFGSLERMLTEFKKAALTQFGSGWAWLVYKANRLDVGNAVNPCPSEKDNKLVICNSPNAVNPLVWDYDGCSHLNGFAKMQLRVVAESKASFYNVLTVENKRKMNPLLAIDVWEHAYYTDYENRRADYVSIFLEKLVSWEVVSHRLDAATEKAAKRAREDEKRRQDDDEDMPKSEAVEMYLDSDSDDSETE